MPISTNKQLDLHAQTNRQATDSQGIYTDPTTKGVTVAWLAESFGMTEQTVRNRLRNCPIKLTRQRGDKMRVKMYDIRTAARYLVAPAFSTREYMKNLKKGDLPPQLQESVWNALLKRQRWEENAKTLWRTEAIREVLGSTFQTIKFTMQLWVETVERHEELSPEQRAMIVDLVDGLQKEVYEALVTNMNSQRTGPQIADLETMFGETESVDAMVAMAEDDEEEDEEIRSLV